ncbi:MAG TPA: HD domain-containing protein, partial [Azonexus sp.]|nr:HD domain-containing protein [Azonexus sp.]
MENVARSLTVALGERDTHTRVHCERVVQLAEELGRHIELSAAEIELLALGAQFHDIGKIGIPDSVLRKPAPFENAEWECMKQHPLIG